MPVTHLVNLPYFHGTIDTRECRELLPEFGDFLIRNHVKDVDRLPSSACVLTVAVSAEQASKASQAVSSEYTFKQQCTTRLKSYSINAEGSQSSPSNSARKKESASMVYSLQGCSDKFPSVHELCDSWISSKKALPSGGTLARAIKRQPWQLFLSSIQFLDPEVHLGKGAYGKVVKAKLLKEKHDPIDVAVKLSTSEKISDIFTDMFREARAMRRLVHPNIIRLEGVVVEKLPILLVIEFIEGSSLKQALQKKKVPNIMRFPIIAAVMYGLLYIHSQKYIHRDIAARNVMVTSCYRTVKIIDFGMARRGLRFSLGATQKIPMKWLAPEVKRTWTFTAKSDVYSFGVTIWEIFHDGADPRYITNSKTATVKRKGKAPQKKHSAPAVPSSASCSMPITENLDFLPKLFEPYYYNMLSHSVRSRPSMAEMADTVEKTIIPVLPKAVADECKVHMEKRPSFDPKFTADCSLSFEEDEKDQKTMGPSKSPSKTGRSVTPKSKNKKAADEKSGDGPVHKEKASTPEHKAGTPENKEKGKTVKRKKK